jgi:hypothetical protein
MFGVGRQPGPPRRNGHGERRPPARHHLVAPLRRDSQILSEFTLPNHGSVRATRRAWFRKRCPSGSVLWLGRKMSPEFHKCQVAE